MTISSPNRITHEQLEAAETQVARARDMGGGWVRADVVAPVLAELRATWERWPMSRPPFARGHERGAGRALESAFGGRTWDVTRAKALVDGVGMDAAAAALGVPLRELRVFMREFYPEVK